MVHRVRTLVIFCVCEWERERPKRDRERDTHTHRERERFVDVFFEHSSSNILRAERCYHDDRKELWKRNDWSAWECSMTSVSPLASRRYEDLLIEDCVFVVIMGGKMCDVYFQQISPEEGKPYPCKVILSVKESFRYRGWIGLRGEMVSEPSPIRKHWIIFWLNSLLVFSHVRKTLLSLSSPPICRFRMHSGEERKCMVTWGCHCHHSRLLDTYGDVVFIRLSLSYSHHFLVSFRLDFVNLFVIMEVSIAMRQYLPSLPPPITTERVATPHTMSVRTSRRLIIRRSTHLALISTVARSLRSRWHNWGLFLSFDPLLCLYSPRKVNSGWMLIAGFESGQETLSKAH